MTIPVKIGIGALTFTSVTCIGCASSLYFSKDTNVKKYKTISVLIKEKDEHILLSKVNKDEVYWAENWRNYKANSKNIFGLADWTEEGQENLTEALKEKCQELSTKAIPDEKDALYLNVTNYCARYVNMTDEIERNNWKEVDVIGDTNDRTIWQSRINQKSKLDASLKILDITTDNRLDADKLKTGCKVAKTKTKKDEKYSDILKAYEEVCVKKTEEE